MLYLARLDSGTFKCAHFGCFDSTSCDDTKYFWDFYSLFVKEFNRMMGITKFVLAVA